MRWTIEERYQAPFFRGADYIPGEFDALAGAVRDFSNPDILPIRKRGRF
jgi:hypothetical protein